LLAAGTLPLDSMWRSLALLVLGIAHALEGEGSASDSVLREAAEASAADGAVVTESLVLACHSLLATKRGDFDRACRAAPRRVANGPGRPRPRRAAVAPHEPRGRRLLRLRAGGARTRAARA